MFPVRRQRIYTKNHLPVTFFIMHFRFFIHFVCQIFLIRHHTVHEGDQLLFFKHQPEMIFIKSKSLFKFFFCCRFCCRETRCLHTGNFFQITQICCSYSHLYSPSFSNIFSIFSTFSLVHAGNSSTASGISCLPESGLWNQIHFIPAGSSSTVSRILYYQTVLRLHSQFLCRYKESIRCRFWMLYIISTHDHCKIFLHIQRL